MANRILPGYMNQVGAKLEIIVDHDGPAAYNNTGVALTSGETINASDFGIGGFEVVQCDSLSSDGLNECLVTLVGQSTGGPMGNAVTQATIRWFVVSTGSEVSNGVVLSGKAIRLQIRGV
jgi:hypothetical protein